MIHMHQESYHIITTIVYQTQEHSMLMYNKILYWLYDFSIAYK